MNSASAGTASRIPDGKGKGFGAGVLGLAVALLAFLAAGLMAPVAANAEDATQECQAAFGQSFVGFKIDDIDENDLNGAYADPDSGFSVEISNTDPVAHTFDYDASWAVNVIVKGGPDAGNEYFPPSISGTGLHAPVNPNNGEYYGLSHITFCWEPDDAALSVEKTPDSQNISAGEDVVFDITVESTGPGTATDVTLTDPLPGSVSGVWTVSGPDAGDCVSPIVADTLDCSFGDLAAGELRTVTVTAATDYENCTTYDNTATAVATNAAEASDDGQVICLPPDLSIVKTGNGRVKAGDDVVFSITVTNDGPGTAKAQTLKDSLPKGTAGPWAITTQPGGNPCSIANGELTCAFGDVPAGQSLTVEVRAKTSSQKCRVYDNTATAFATNSPAVEDDATVNCSQIKPRLVLKKSGNKKKARPGAKVRYRITVRNTRKGSVAKNLKVCDRVPRLMTVVKKGNNAFFESGRLCWRIKKLPYSKNGKSFSYVTRIANNANNGARLRNVVVLRKLKASHTVKVVAPEVGRVGRRPTPVTG